MSELHTPQFKDYFNLFALSAIWGTAFIGIEFAIEHLHILHVTFGRVLIAMLILLPFVLFRKWNLPKSIQIWFWIFLSALFNTAVPFSLINYGQQYISSGMSALMLGFGPFITLLLAHFLTHDEKFTANKLLGVILGFIGLVILLSSSIFSFDMSHLEGQLAVLLASFSYVTSSILLRKIKNIPFYQLSFIMFLISTFILLPFAVKIPLEISNSNINSIIAVLYLGIFPTAIASLYRIQMVQSVGVQFMSQVAYLIPMFTLLWAWFVFNELPSFNTLIAFFFILLGLYIGKKKVANR
jgi:drug/metabolite transporter (DMT)-like permease